jgi:hypothetical protein
MSVPGLDGRVEAGTRVYNWVWFRRYFQHSGEYKEIITDNEDRLHRFTLPLGKIREEVWTRQKELAHELLAPSVAEVVTKTQRPFIQVITEPICPKAVFFDGKVMIVDDGE